MGYYLSFAFLLVAAVLENSVLLDYRLLDGQPSLVLMIVLGWAWYADLDEAIFWAFLGGILLDVMNPIMPLGVSVIAPLVMVFAVKAAERAFYDVSILALIAFVILGTVLHHIIVFIVLGLQGASIAPIAYVRTFTAPTLLFNLLGTFPIFFVLRRFQKRIPRRQSAWDVTPRS